jgi:hypothetical protein
MAEKIEVKLVEISEATISIQNQDATLFDHVVRIDQEKLDRYKQIQRDFVRMQNELFDLIRQS